jgi:hypothetical protein
MDDDVLLEVGTVRVPTMKPSRAEWGLLAQPRFKSLAGGEYRMFVRSRGGVMDRAHVVLVREKAAAGFDVCEGVPVDAIVSDPERYKLLPQVEVNEGGTELTIPEAAARLFRTPVLAMAADAVAPGLSLITRVGEMALLLGDDDAVDGVYRGMNQGHGIVEKPDGHLTAVPYDPALARFQDGDAIVVRRAGEELTVEKGGGRAGAAVDRADAAESALGLTHALFPR